MRATRPSARLQLRYLAHARSGDKGDTANVGLIALEPEYYPILAKEVTRARVARHFSGMVSGVERYGKSVVIELEKAGATRYPVAELGMTGLLLFPSVSIKFPQHVHFTMKFVKEQTPTVRYWNPRRFSRLSLLDREGLDRYRARRFGCDPLTVTPEEFCELIRSRRRRLEDSCRCRQ